MKKSIVKVVGKRFVTKVNKRTKRTHIHCGLATVNRTEKMR